MNNTYREINLKVCKLWQKNGLISPLCDDRDQYKIIDDIAQEHNLSMEVMIGITYTESHIGTNFAPNQNCSIMNNWSWIKAKKNDDWTSNKYKLPYSWCWLYPFKDMKEFWESLANTISIGYVKWWCNNLKCLSSWYVGKQWSIKWTRVNNVEYFINYKI